MSAQASSARRLRTGAAVQTWVRLLHAHAAATRELSAELVSSHGLTLNDYEVLLHLERAPERRMRRVDLAESVLLTPSGMTRLLEGLELAGLVCRGECSSDRRVSYAVLTEAGRARLRAAARTHLAGIDRLFGERFAPEELEALSALLGRLPGGELEGDCGSS